MRLRYGSNGGFIAGILLPFLLLAVAGISFRTLAWSCFAWGISLGRTPSRTGGLSWLLAALSAFMGDSPGGLVCLLVACILELALRDRIAERTACLASMLLATADGGLTGMTLPLLGCAFATAFGRRSARGWLCAAGIVAGLFLHGPPAPSDPEPWREVRLPARWPTYEWHDTLAVTRSAPRLRVCQTSMPDSLFHLEVTATLGAGSGREGWIRQGYDLHRITDGTDTLVLESREPYEVVLPGAWRPFSPDRIALRTLGRLRR